MTNKEATKLQAELIDVQNKLTEEAYKRIEADEEPIVFLCYGCGELILKPAKDAPWFKYGKDAFPSHGICAETFRKDQRKKAIKSKSKQSGSNAKKE